MKVAGKTTVLNKNVCQITLVYCLQVNANRSHRINPSTENKALILSVGSGFPTFCQLSACFLPTARGTVGPQEFTASLGFTSYLSKLPELNLPQLERSRPTVKSHLFPQPRKQSWENEGPPVQAHSPLKVLQVNSWQNSGKARESTAN